MVEVVKSKHLKAGFSMRGDNETMKVSSRTSGTIEEVAENLNNFILGEQGIEPMAYLYLVGGSDTVCIDQPIDGNMTLLNCDGAVTNQPITLAITVADCFPVMLVDKYAGIAGISHAGWKGSKDLITSKVVNEMIALGADTKNIKVMIGPGICINCFEVGEEVAQLFDNSIVDRENYEKPHVDILQSNLNELHKLGIDDIELISTCTYENPGQYYSARKEEITGRFIAYISNKS